MTDLSVTRPADQAAGQRGRSAAYRAARATWRAAGRRTAPIRLLPSFLIVGAQRCGTTSLFTALSQHPGVRMPLARKGIHYFDVGYQHDLSWYRGHFPLAIPGSRVITGESSPYYMFHPLAPQRIASDLPSVRLIVALRDPVERAYSAHAHELARGFETEPFERALELETGRLADAGAVLHADGLTEVPAHRHQAYLTRGQYIEQLERLEDLVGRARIHVVDSAVFFTAPEPEFAQVLSYLGLPSSDKIRFGQHNARPRAPMPGSLRRRLEEHFQPYDERLARWLGRVPSWRT
jgi:Sulfotransferase domain